MSPDPTTTTFFGAPSTPIRTPVPAVATLPARTPGFPSHERTHSGGAGMYATTGGPGPSSSPFVKPMDEFGYTSASSTAGGPTVTTVPTSRPVVPPINTGAATPRPTSMSRPAPPNSNRLTITNAEPSEPSSYQTAAGGSHAARQQDQGSQRGGNEPWISAQEEKRRYEEARRRVEETQHGVAPVCYISSRCMVRTDLFR